MLSFLKKFWLLVAIIVAIVSWFVYVQVTAYILQQRFDLTYVQLNSVYQSLQDSSLATRDGQDSITKECRNIGSGIESTIECGVYIDFSMDMQATTTIIQLMNSTLDRLNFEDIDFKHDPQAQLGQVADRITFISEFGISCNGYWSEKKTNSSEKHFVDMSLYCREVVPDYLSGYTRE